MDIESYKKFYEYSSNDYSPEEGEHYYRDDRFYNVRHFVNKQINECKNILDVGCGNGYQISPFALENKVYGLDISKACVDKALSKGIKAILHDIEKPFPFDDDYFEIIVCSEILEHLFFPEKVLKECHRVLKSSGSLIVTVPNLYCLRNRLSMFIGRNCWLIEYPQNKQHIRFYSLLGMKNILKKNAFKVNQYRGQGFAMNYFWPFKLIWYLHGGNRGLRTLIKIFAFGKTTHIPGLLLQFHIIRFAGRLFPTLSPGLIFECQKMS